jgi:hypothetical protein
MVDGYVKQIKSISNTHVQELIAKKRSGYAVNAA